MIRYDEILLEYFPKNDFCSSNLEDLEVMSAKKIEEISLKLCQKYYNKDINKQMIKDFILYTYNYIDFDKLISNPFIVIK